MKSSIFTLNKADFVKGFIIAIVTSVLTIIYNTVQNGSLVFDWKGIATAATSAAIAYILKNLLTNSNDQFLKPEAK